MLINPVFGTVGYYFYSSVFNLVFLVEHSELKDVKECRLSDSRVSGKNHQSCIYN